MNEIELITNTNHVENANLEGTKYECTCSIPCAADSDMNLDRKSSARDWLRRTFS